MSGLADYRASFDLKRRLWKVNNSIYSNETEYVLSQSASNDSGCYLLFPTSRGYSQPLGKFSCGKPSAPSGGGNQPGSRIELIEAREALVTYLHRTIFSYMYRCNSCSFHHSCEDRGVGLEIPEASRDMSLVTF